MAITKQQIAFGQVMHNRLTPKCNKFIYNIYYIAVPLSEINTLLLPRNKFAPLSFYDKDHGLCDGSSLEKWAREILNDYGITSADGEITLICMPRVLGYVFNPVSFWVCHDKQGNIRAILYEVHNTFGERHTYICAHKDQKIITPNETLIGDKIFHVSPMLERNGHYKFRFKMDNKNLGIWIDYHDKSGVKTLETCLTAHLETMSKKAKRKAFWAYPLVTLKAIILIHWQALKILSKGIPYLSKPPQKDQKVSSTSNLKKI